MVVGSVIIDQVSKGLAEKTLVWVMMTRCVGMEAEELVVFGRNKQLWLIGKLRFISVLTMYVIKELLGIFSDLKDSIRIPLFYFITILQL